MAATGTNLTINGGTQRASALALSTAFLACSGALPALPMEASSAQLVKLALSLLDSLLSLLHSTMNLRTVDVGDFLGKLLVSFQHDLISFDVSQVQQLELSFLHQILSAHCRLVMVTSSRSFSTFIMRETWTYIVFYSTNLVWKTCPQSG
jgi:hypothetical protein